MAQIIVFHYVHKDTPLHRMDGRLKLLCLLLLSLSASLALTWPHYLALSGVLVLSLIAARLPIIALLRDLKLFGVIIIVVLIANAFFISGDPIPFFPLSVVSWQGLVTGLSFATRLILIVLICAVMMGTTPLSTYKNALEWYLRPLPFIPEGRVAAMFNLTFLFIPVILDTYRETMNAQKARCVGLSKNPVRRIKYLVFPLLTQTLKKTDEIVCALESRCFSEVRTQAEWRTSRTDWLVLICCLGILLSVVLLGRG